MATTLERVYSLPDGKNLSGIAQSVTAFFEEFIGTEVIMTNVTKDTVLISCITKPLFSSFSGFSERLLGCDMDISVKLYQNSDKVIVVYHQDIDNLKRLFKGVFQRFVVFGLGDIFGALLRHNIPFGLHQTIKAYLTA